VLGAAGREARALRSGRAAAWSRGCGPLVVAVTLGVVALASGCATDATGASGAGAVGASRGAAGAVGASRGAAGAGRGATGRGAAAEQERVGRVASPIVNGVDSTDVHDAVVLIKHYDAVQIGGGAEGCTGTMLTPRLVLTARHCVAESDPQAACDSEGNPQFGGKVIGNYPANKLFAFSGATRPDFLGGLDHAARGVEILDDGSTTICNHDIAFLLLDSPLPFSKVAPVRLTAASSVGEQLTIVGWGVTETTPTPERRRARAGVATLTVGPAAGLGPAELQLGEGGCAGDSGGPALSAAGAVVGVLSRGGNGTDARPGDPAGCIGGTNVFTRVAGHEAFVRAAYAKANQAPWDEGQPEPGAGDGAAPAEAEAEKDSGCSVSGAHGVGRGGSSAALALALAFALAFVASATRRRR